ncbi:MAG TPA: hypothetical protein ENK32_12940 [Anaerolineae bacterium]|nr:hypothetical protein [Anaerolineae bacterium]
MKETTETIHCLNCHRLETEIPLVALRFRGQQTWICSLCLPVLIHKPQQLVGKLEGMAKLSEPVTP